MKIKIERQPHGQVKLTLQYDSAKPPICIEGKELDGLLSLVAAAKSAETTTFKVEVEIR